VVLVVMVIEEVVAESTDTTHRGRGCAWGMRGVVCEGGKKKEEGRSGGMVL
jgi:hypothetical protein